MNINKYKKIFILIFLFGFLAISRSFAYTYSDEGNPNIISPNSVNIDYDILKSLVKDLENHKCIDTTVYSGQTPSIYTPFLQNTLKKFQSTNNIKSDAVTNTQTWDYLSTASGTKAKDGKVVKDCDLSTTGGGVAEGGEGDINSEVTPYKNVGSFSGESTTTNISNTDAAGLGDAINYLITIAGVAIVILIIYRVLQGAIIKGTFDNIYDQQNAKKSFRTAGIGLIIFIFAYAVLSFINPDLTGWTFVEKVSIDTYSSLTGSTGSNLNCNVEGYKSLNIVDMLKQDEGSKNVVYKDSLDLATIGVGFNLERASKDVIKAELIKAGVSENDANDLATNKINSKVKLTDEQINKLLLTDIESHKNAYAIPFATKAGKDFNKLPQNIQLVLMDMSFMGKYMDFVDMNAALAKDDYEGVGKEIIDSKYCSQVGDRCTRLAKLAGAKCTVSNSIGNQSLSGLLGQCKGIPESQTVVVQGIKVNKDIEGRVNSLLNGIKAAGLNFNGSTGWRSTEQQQALRVAHGCPNPSSPSKSCRPETAKPGCSNHEKGLAIDFKSNGSTIRAGSPLYNWLMANANKKEYGEFYKLPSESWHFSINGK